MNKTIKEIFAFVEPEMKQFREEFDKLTTSDVKLMRQILKYLFKHKGKQIRPLYVILSSGLCGGINETTYKAAALIELLHTATLVHDDVVDEAEKRRGFFTINSLWKNKAAVLVGDYLLAKGLLIALDNNYFDMLKIVSEATRQMSEGEILQMQKSRKWEIDEKVYYEIISKKTASLFAVCFQLGGLANNADAETLKKLNEIGINIGIAFQIKDDLLDFEENNNKNAFADLKEQKLTLPLIHALSNSDYFEKLKFTIKIKRFKKQTHKSKEIVEWLKSKNSLAYSENEMNKFAIKAIDLINEFPENEYRESIKNTINFILNRNY